MTGVPVPPAIVARGRQHLRGHASRPSGLPWFAAGMCRRGENGKRGGPANLWTKVLAGSNPAAGTGRTLHRDRQPAIFRLFAGPPRLVSPRTKAGLVPAFSFLPHRRFITHLCQSHCCDTCSRDTEDLHHERRVSNHVRRDGMVAERVNPSVARAQRQDALEHPGPDVTEQDKQQREGDVP